MRRKIFVQIPTNNPSGGNKVANQLVNLFREHNYEAYVVLPAEMNQAKWLINPAPTINIARMKELCGADDIVIDNWIDRETVNETMKLKAKIKIYYSQGCTFYKSKNLIGDDFLKKDLGYTHFWVVSSDSLEYLKKKYPRIKKWYLIHPYLNHDFNIDSQKNWERKNEILCFSRKGRWYIEIARMFYQNKIKFNVIDKFTEREGYELMLSHKFFLSTAIGVNKQFIRNIARFLKYGNTNYNIKVISPNGYKEGFPLPPAEAAMCGSIVIGFAMGGGLEWMSPKTCFLAKDRSYFSLIKKLKEALSASDEHLNTMRENAFKAVSKFNREHTWQQIKAFLKEENIE